MSYTLLAVLSIAAVVVIDLYVMRTRLITRRIFWTSYAIIVFFQLVTNGVLTGFRIVRYDGEVIIGGLLRLTKHPRCSVTVGSCLPQLRT